MNIDSSLPKPSSTRVVYAEGHKSPLMYRAMQADQDGVRSDSRRDDGDRTEQARTEDIRLAVGEAMQAQREEIRTRIDQAVQAERDRLQREAILWAQKFLQENRKLREDVEESRQSNAVLEQKLISRFEESQKEIRSLHSQLQEQKDTISTDLRPRLRRMKYRLQVHMDKHVEWRQKWEKRLDVRLEGLRLHQAA